MKSSHFALCCLCLTATHTACTTATNTPTGSITYDVTQDSAAQTKAEQEAINALGEEAYSSIKEEAEQYTLAADSSGQIGSKIK